MEKQTCNNYFSDDLSALITDDDNADIFQYDDFKENHLVRS